MHELHPDLPQIPTAPGADLPLPDQFDGMRSLAYNMWWSWDGVARDLWHRISPSGWAKSSNPITILQALTPDDWASLRSDRGLLDAYGDVLGRFDDYMGDVDTWYATEMAGALPGCAAYLSAEFGIHETLPFYSGGLGVLAGDHLKAASDLGIPLVGVGLFYRRGYFGQAIDPGGFQQHQYRPIEVETRAVKRVLDDGGRPLIVSVDFPGRRVDVGVWRIDVGRVPLLLLDTDLPSNDPADRPITHILYVRGREMRLSQEIVLGVGAVRVLQALGFSPSVWHVNEGHAAISLLERVGQQVGGGAPVAEAAGQVASQSIFTLHTPVPAGNEAFDLEMALRHLGAAVPDLGPDTLQTMAYGGRPDLFDMGAVAIRLTRSTNGVSRKHAEVASGDWDWLIGGPAAAVTNGVHLPTWVGRSVARRFENSVGPHWAELTTGADWEKVAEISDEDLWDAHLAQKDQMLRDLRSRLREQGSRHGAAPDDLRTINRLLPLDRLTVVFARRFATYKRAGLLLTDETRLERILTDPDRPVQLIFAGKAHPADDAGKEIIRRVWEMAHSPSLSGHVFMIEDYDIGLARNLVAGADVWLNSPRPPMEASGTSGMKAAANGAINLSTGDGWWLEGADGSNGWTFGTGGGDNPTDAESLYDLLESSVIPAFYGVGSDGLPRRWVGMMRRAILTVPARFSARRMVSEYATELYRPQPG